MSLTILVYIFLSFLSISFGILYFVYPKISSVLFLIIGLLIPSSNQFMEFTSYSGIYFYDYFFLSVSIYYLFQVIVTQNIRKSNIYNISLFLFIFLFYIIIAISSSISIDKYFLRDLRPFLLLFYGLVFIDLLRAHRISLPIILNVLLFSFIIKIIFIIFQIFGASFSDVYYENNSFRYFDASTFVASLFLLIGIFKKSSLLLGVSKYKLNIIKILAITIILISNLRIFLLALLIVYLIFHNKNILKKLFIVVITIFLFLSYSYIMQIDRVINAFELNNIVMQLANRFSPAIIKISQMNFYNYIYGLGLGTYFDIPWFEYRGLDSKLNTIDSTYLTFFVKYGLVSIGVLFLFFKILLKNVNDLLLKRALIIFYLIVFLTVSVLYQSGAVIQILFINMLMISINNEDSTHSVSINT
tara:strand:- start:1211 stop:2455 length:1245 start_codon:yes stop_codon:yes gene_type:complete